MSPLGNYIIHKYELAKQIGVMGIAEGETAGMPEILIRCPTLGRMVSTGLTTEKIKLSSLSDLKFRLLCPACLKTHRWGPKEAWIYERGKLTKRSK